MSIQNLGPGRYRVWLLLGVAARLGHANETLVLKTWTRAGGAAPPASATSPADWILRGVRLNAEPDGR